MRNDSEKNDHVLVAMSGGVDSSVALLLLKRQGYTVAGATMKLWDYVDVGGDTRRQGCCDLDAINNARAVCDALDVSHYVLDFSDRFRETVIENFVSEYCRGRTPNPCVLCNTEIKWHLFLRRAREIGYGTIATGHYARAGYDEGTGRHWLRRAIDLTRDQSYALWGIDQASLERTLLPMGTITKKEARQIAAEAGLKTARVAESMEICFVADNDYQRFIRDHTSEDIPAGDIVNESGQVLGRHRGIPFYTIGQRRGLGISHPTPLYVKEIDAENNRIVVGEKAEVAGVEMAVSRVNWVSAAPREEPFCARVKIRYQHTPQPATVTPDPGNTLVVSFDSPQAAITPGQSAVVYDGDLVLAGGIID